MFGTAYIPYLIGLYNWVASSRTQLSIVRVASKMGLETSFSDVLTPVMQRSRAVNIRWLR